MAKYTIELRKVCEIYGRDEVENWFKDYEITDFLSPSQIDTINKLNVWNKDKLAKKIVDENQARKAREDFGFEEVHETTYTKENPVEHALMVKASEADDNRLVG